MTNETRDRHTCVECGKHFMVVYHQADPDEPSRSVPAACPYCRAINRVPVGSAAALASECRAVRLGF